MENVEGVFYVLFGGWIFAIIFGSIQALLYCVESARKAKVFLIIFQHTTLLIQPISEHFRYSLLLIKCCSTWVCPVHCPITIFRKLLNKFLWKCLFTFLKKNLLIFIDRCHSKKNYPLNWNSSWNSTKWQKRFDIVRVKRVVHGIQLHRPRLWARIIQWNLYERNDDDLLDVSKDDYRQEHTWSSMDSGQTQVSNTITHKEIFVSMYSIRCVAHSKLDLFWWIE